MLSDIIARSKIVASTEYTSKTTTPFVACSVRPLNDIERTAIQSASPPSESSISCEGRKIEVTVDALGLAENFSFEGCVDHTNVTPEVVRSSRLVSHEVTRRAVLTALDGGNAIVTPFGDKGSGRTYLLFGEKGASAKAAAATDAASPNASPMKSADAGNDLHFDPSTVTNDSGASILSGGSVAQRGHELLEQSWKAFNQPDSPKSKLQAIAQHHAPSAGLVGSFAKLLFKEVSNLEKRATEAGGAVFVRVTGYAFETFEGFVYDLLAQDEVKNPSVRVHPFNGPYIAGLQGNDCVAARDVMDVARARDKVFVEHSRRNHTLVLRYVVEVVTIKQGEGGKRTSFVNSSSITFLDPAYTSDFDAAVDDYTARLRRTAGRGTPPPQSPMKVRGGEQQQQQQQHDDDNEKDDFESREADESDLEEDQDDVDEAWRMKSSERSVLSTLLLHGIVERSKLFVIGTLNPNPLLGDRCLATLRSLNKIKEIALKPSSNSFRLSDAALDIRYQVEELQKRLDLERMVCIGAMTPDPAYGQEIELRQNLVTWFFEAERELEVKLGSPVMDKKVEESTARTWASIFRQAFLIRRREDTMTDVQRILERQNKELVQRVDTITQALAAVRIERDQCKADLRRTNKELTVALDKNQNDQMTVAKAREEASAVRRELEAAVERHDREKVRLEKIVHDAHEKDLELSRENSVLTRRIQYKEEEIEELHLEFEEKAKRWKNIDDTRAQQSTTNDHRWEEEVEKLKTLNVLLHNQVDSYKMQIVEHERNEERLAKERDALLESREEQTKVIESRVKKAAEMFAVEKESYAALLSEGNELVSELAAVEQSLVDAQAMIQYRSGFQGVRAWLQQHDAEVLLAQFERAAFLDLESVAAITEPDLVDMGLKCGVRRKLLAAAEQLKAKLASQGGKKPATTVRNLLDDLYRWIDDFREAVAASNELLLSPPGSPRGRSPMP